MNFLSSPQNPRFRQWKTLGSSKGIREAGLFIISGEKLVLEALHQDHIKVKAEIRDQEMPSLGFPGENFVLPRDLFNQLDELGTQFNLLVAELPEIPPWDSHHSPQGLEVFCPLQDPQNVGALLRSCEAFGASKVILLEESAHPFLPKALRASAGSAMKVSLFKGPKMTDLRGDFFGLDLDGDPLTTCRLPKDLRLVVGEEGLGLKRLSPTAKLKRLTIPTQGVESLNAVVASSLALYTYRQQNSV